MSRFYKTHNITPLAGLVSLVQLPITFGLFFGVQKVFNLPLEQLKDSSVAFLPIHDIIERSFTRSFGNTHQFLFLFSSQCEFSFAGALISIFKLNLK
jgi:hypothetical protein